MMELRWLVTPFGRVLQYRMERPPNDEEVFRDQQFAHEYTYYTKWKNVEEVVEQ